MDDTPKYTVEKVDGIPDIEAVKEDKGVKIPLQQSGDHVIPLQGQLAAPNERLYYNRKVEKPKRKIKDLEVSFGKLTH